MQHIYDLLKSTAIVPSSYNINYHTVDRDIGRGLSTVSFDRNRKFINGEDYTTIMQLLPSLHPRNPYKTNNESAGS